MKHALFVLVFVLTAFNLLAFGRREKVNDTQHLQAQAQPGNIEAIDSNSQAGAEMENTINIVGTVRIYGNEPHTFAGILGEDGTEYAVFPPSKENEIRELQGHLIEFAVILLEDGQGYGSLFLRGGTVTPVSWRLVQ